MKNYLTFFLLLLSSLLFSQKKQIIVLNDNDEPIPYINVLINKAEGIGLISNHKGILTVTKELESNIKDSVIISCVGYTSLSLNREKFILKDTIHLKQADFLLSEFTVKSGKPKTFFLGSHNIKGHPGYFLDVPGTEIAYFVPATSESIGKTIKKMYAFISKEGVPTSDFKILIYSSKGAIPKPDKILVNENIIVNAKKGNEWVSFDILKHNVKFPKSGIFISVMWLNNASEYTYVHKRKIRKNVEFKLFGQVLKAVCTDNKSYLNSVWSRNNLLKEEWVNQKDGMLPLIKCEIIKEILN
ncbi:MAG: hypothetical protein ACPGSO_03385 [Vicingaceae bacterium]